MSATGAAGTTARLATAGALATAKSAAAAPTAAAARWALTTTASLEWGDTATAAAATAAQWVATVPTASTQQQQQSSRGAQLQQQQHSGAQQSPGQPQQQQQPAGALQLGSPAPDSYQLETLTHLFVQCPIAVAVWAWFARVWSQVQPDAAVDFSSARVLLLDDSAAWRPPQPLCQLWTYLRLLMLESIWVVRCASNGRPFTS